MADNKIDWNARFASYKMTGPSPRSGMTNTPETTANAKAFATGAFYDFPTGLAGMPGDIGRLAVIPQTEGFIPSPAAVMSKLPSTADVQNYVSGLTGFTPKPYEEMTTAEKYARTVGSFLPNALTAPQKTLAKGAARAMPVVENLARRAANVVIPGVASEAAGQAVEGEPLEPVARVAGALLGSRVAGGLPTPQTAAKKTGVPLEVLKDQTNQAYTGLRNAGIVYDRNAFVNTLDDAANEIRLGGVDSEAVSRIVNNLKGIGQNELDWTRLDTIRQNLSKIAYGGNTVEGDQLAARMVLKKINELETSPNFYMKPGAEKLSASDIAAKTKEARDLAQRRIKTRQIESIIDIAPTYAGTPENNIRSGFRRLLRDIKKKESIGWSKEEIAAIEDVAEGRKIVQALSALAPTLKETIANKGIGALSLAGGYAAGGLAVPAAQLAVGVPARVMSGRRTGAAAERAAALVSAPKAIQQDAITAAEMARRGIGQRYLLTAPSLLGGGLLDEGRR